MPLFPYRIERQQEHSFIASALRPGSVVIDLGLNHGRFADAMVRDHGCRVYGLEPVRASYEHAALVTGLIAECAAIAEHDGTTELHIHPTHGATVRQALAPKTPHARVVTPAVSLATFIARHGLAHVDLLKMDVEGSEIQVLDTVPPSVLQGVAQITVEFHDAVDASLAEDGARVTRRLESLGFVALRFSRTSHDVLFVNRRHLPLSRPGAAWLLLRYKYLRGLGRIARRKSA